MYAVECGSTHTACLVTMTWVSDDLIKNCMACKNKFSLVNRKVCNNIQVSPEGEVNSGGYIPRRESSRYIFTALHRP